MMRYYKRMKDETEEFEITYDEALRTLLGTWRDSDLTRDMLTIQNNIVCMYSFIRVDDPDSKLKPMPGLWNMRLTGSMMAGMRLLRRLALASPRASLGPLRMNCVRVL